MPSLGSDIKTLYEQQGYVIVSGLILEGDWPKLESACQRVAKLTREGSWPHRRTVGKQFPPYGDENPDSWGVQHIMHPDLQEPAFANWYTSPKLLGAVTTLLQCQTEDLQMELFNLLINPVSHNFALRWHRDDVREDATPEQEDEALKIWHHGVQWNRALYTDSCLFVVPGSHKVPRTAEQRALSSGQIPDNPLDMPGALQLILQPGETVFYNNNILHCAKYNSKEKRATLHGCIGDSKGGSSRARNLLQHGLEWMKEEKFRSSLSNNLSRSMLDKLIAMHDTNPRGSALEYSLEN